MYFGSVRFFRHVIIGFIVLALLVTTSLSIVFGMQCKDRIQYADGKVYKVDEDYEAMLAGYHEEDREPVSGMPEELQEILKETDIGYQGLYPEMKIDAQIKFQQPQDKTVYLTFDDGPSSVTPEILDTLAKYNIKATFFVVGKQLSESGIEMLKRVIAEGHTVGIHTYSHDYKVMYESVEAYLEDFYQAYNIIVTETGYQPSIFRFPGGSINAYNQSIYQQIIAEMARRGFVFFDWNNSAEDTVAGHTTASIIANVTKDIKEEGYTIVLMHDTIEETGAALDSIINNLLQRNYNFDSLNRETRPITFTYK